MGVSVEDVSEKSDGQIHGRWSVLKVSGTDKEASTHTCAASALPEYVWASLLFSLQLLQPSDVNPSSSSSWGLLGSWHKQVHLFV